MHAVCVCVQEDELRSMALKEEIEKLQEEKSMLLETIEDLKQIVEQTEPKASVCVRECVRVCVPSLPQREGVCVYSRSD